MSNIRFHSCSVNWNDGNPQRWIRHDSPAKGLFHCYFVTWATLMEKSTAAAYDALEILHWSKSSTGERVKFISMCTQTISERNCGDFQSKEKKSASRILSTVTNFFSQSSMKKESETALSVRVCGISIIVASKHIHRCVSHRPDRMQRDFRLFFRKIKSQGTANRQPM